ncbi:MAG: hypothetical protein ACYDBQ_07610 [Thermoplasmatota archaeon]
MEVAVTEGATRLLVPEGNLGRPRGAPGARQAGEPFYNPAMAGNRDLSVLLVEAWAHRLGREIDVADALCGTGARAVRLAHEVQAPLIVHANDGQPEAVAAAARTAHANDVPQGRLVLEEGDAHPFLAARRYDVVDIDPCGSPAPFLDAAVRATRHGGLVCLTATDTGALAGAFPRVAKRRYDAHHGLHAAAWRAEVGLRILAGTVVRSAARFERCAEPVLSLCRGHWMRVVLRVTDGRSDADTVLRKLGRATLDPESGNGRWLLPPEHPPEWAGPLWGGPLHDGELVAGMQKAAEGKALAEPQVGAFLDLLAAEAGAPPFWVTADELQRHLGPPAPRRDELITRLRKDGFQAARTHLDPRGVRTDATARDLRGAWVCAGRP